MSKALALASVALASVGAFNPPLPALLPCLRATSRRDSALQVCSLVLMIRVWFAFLEAQSEKCDELWGCAFARLGSVPVCI
jgi:hypothetical protein